MKDLVIVSGGSGGIGKAITSAFKARGFVVASLDRKTGGGEFDFEIDLSQDSNLDQIIEGLSSGYHLAHLVGVAGGAVEEEREFTKAGKLPDGFAFEKAINENLLSQYRLLYSALDHLTFAAQAGKKPSVSLVSSTNALTGYGQTGYSAAKAGLIGLMHASATYLGARGIRINVVAPGTVITPKMYELYKGREKELEKLAKSSALGHAATPEDIAKSTTSLALDLTHVTGHTLVVDGGQMVKRN